MGREEKSTWGLAGATQDPSVPHHVPQDSPQSLRHAPCPSEYHPRECRRAAPLCYGTEPGAIPVSPTPLHLHTHGVPYPGDCKPGAMPGVLVPGVVPRTPSQRQGAAARCCAQGTAPRYGMPVGPGEPSQARRGEAGSRRSPKAWACAELGAFSAAQAARTQRPCPRSGARGGLPGHEPGPCARCLGSTLPGLLAQPEARATVGESVSGWD